MSNIYINRFDSLIQFITIAIFPACDWRLIKAQMLQESGAEARAVSPVGAKGLLQLMPATAHELGFDVMELFDPEQNLQAGVKYLRIQYSHMPEIRTHDERIKFSLGAYNGGRGYINKALELAYESDIGADMPPGHRGAFHGKWQTWDYTKAFLASPLCEVNGRRPDWKQMVQYVEKIWTRYRRSTCRTCKGAGEVNNDEGIDNVNEPCPQCG